jgi:hypothetical protein
MDSVPLDIIHDDDDECDEKPRSLMEQCVDAFYSFEYKSYAFLFIIFILVTSDVFVNLMLKKINGATDSYGSVTPFGVVMQGLMLVLAHIIMHSLVKREII